MDREVPSKILKKEKSKKYLKAIIILILLIVGFISFRFFLKASARSGDFITAVADRGDIDETLVASGIVIPEYELTISSPIQAKIDCVIYNVGARVEVGTSIVVLNKEYTLITHEKLKGEQEVNRNKITQLRWKLKKGLLDLKTQLEIKKLKVKSLETFAKDEKDLLKIGGTTEENVAQADLNLNIEKLQMNQLTEDIANSKQSTQADLKELSLEIENQNRRIKELESKMSSAEIRATRTGVITWVNDKIGTVINEGEEIVRLADLNSYKVEGSISEVYAGRLSIGGDVIIRTNSEKTIEGKISSIKPTVENGVVNFTIALKEKNEKTLRPSLKVEVFIVLSRQKDVVRVKNGSVFNEKGEQEIFVLEEDKAVKRKVRLGVSNYDYVQIESGLESGEVVIISNMPEYDHLDEFDIVD